MDAEQIFQEAVEISDPRERAAYIDRACKDDDRLRTAVEALLRADEAAGDFLESPAVAPPGATLGVPPSIEGPGTKIGHYELLELIGEGGMGLVYLAQQKEPVRRKVVLKIVKPGMDSRQVIARFEAERQVLAILDHPNIARVFDAGTTEMGRPYFVMEYVKGVSITRYCDEKKLNIEQRLRLFEQVCEGIHHAHQKGIIHRDIKPSNILVSAHGDTAVPKIIDFGIAKAITQPLTDKTFVTFQGQLLGTPEYMSPEQVDSATQDIDTRSDIYSLGLVLYELLTGVLPFEEEYFSRRGLAEIQQTIRELEPVSPSMRLSKLGEKAKTIAASRCTQVVPLARRLHRELEWIPLKAMRKDRCRRYKSASDMAEDIRNYLNGNPLIAGPETAIYRVRKFVHKHTGSVATVAVVAVAILLGLAISTVMYFNAEDARQKESDERTQAQRAEKDADEQKRIAEQLAEEYRRSVYCNKVSLAQFNQQNLDVRRSRELLVSCPEDLRGWEWSYLWHACDQSELTLKGHYAAVSSVAVSADGRYIVSGSRDGTVRVWDAATGKEIKRLRAEADSEPVRAVAISHDGQRIAATTGASARSPIRNSTIHIWRTESGTEEVPLRGHQGPVTTLAFDREDKRLFSAAGGLRGQMLKIWDPASGKELGSMTIGAPIRSLSLNPDGTQMAVSMGGAVKILDIASANVLKAVFDPNVDPNGPRALSVDYSPDGKRIVSGGSDGKIRICDAISVEVLLTWTGHMSNIGCVKFSPDGSRIVSCGGNDRTVRIWDSATGAEIKTLLGHEENVTSVVFSPDGSRVISASRDGTVKVWNWKKEVGVKIKEALPLSVSGRRSMLNAGTYVAWLPDGTRFVAVGENGPRDLCIWDAEKGTELMTLRDDSQFPNPITCVAVSPDGTLIASGHRNSIVKVWSVNAREVIHTLSGPGQPVPVCSLVFDPDGQRLVSGQMNGMIKIWEIKTGREIRAIADHPYPSAYPAVAFLPGGAKLVRARFGDIDILELATGKTVTLRGHVAAVWSVAVSPDGRLIVSGGTDKTVRIWDAETGNVLKILHGHTDAVNSVGFSPDGRRIVSCSDDGTIKLWDAATGEECITLRGEGGSVFTVAFSPLNNRIVSSCAQAVAEVWEAPANSSQLAEPRNSRTGQMVAWWKFDETEGDIAKDSSGHGLDGVLKGNPQRISGRDGGALFFNGNEDFIDCGSRPAFDITDSITIAAWIRASAFDSAWATIITKGGDNAWRLQQHIDSNSLEFGVGNWIWAPDLTAFGRIRVDDEHWHHVAGTCDGRTIKLYVDGVLETSHPVSLLDEMGRNDSPVSIGGNATVTGRTWHGAIDDVRIYDYALSQEQIKSLIPPHLEAVEPQPFEATTILDCKPQLRWLAGQRASTHEIYFGSDKQAVAEATKTSPQYKGNTPLGREIYEPDQLSLGTTFYWRIDEVNESSHTTWHGNTWCFSTTGYVPIDDFENYNDSSATLSKSWRQTGNSRITLATDDEPNAVHSGKQSLRYTFGNVGGDVVGNSKLACSKPVHDWTNDNVKVLSLWFKGHGPTTVVGDFKEEPNGIFAMKGMGRNRSFRQDGFHFAWKTLEGDGSIVARVLSVQDTDPWAQAAVMVREDLGPGAKCVIMSLTPGRGCNMLVRTGSDQPIGSSPALAPRQMAAKAPFWIKLERNGDNFSAYYSSDPQTEPWVRTPWNPRTVSMSSKVFIGLALTSHAPGVICEARFSDVEITGKVSGEWNHQDIGISNDAKPMYIAVTDGAGKTAVEKRPNPSATQIDKWTQWNIDLGTFSGKGVNLADIRELTIGIGDPDNQQPGGFGVMYFDDIRLYVQQSSGLASQVSHE